MKHFNWKLNFYYLKKKTDNNPCSSSPCGLNGICIDNQASCSFSCLCNYGYTGIFCATRLCDLTCLNGGSCQLNNNLPTCTCPCLYNGTVCQNFESPCYSNPCLNNGICTPVTQTCSYQCSCPSSYTGVTCATRLCDLCVICFTFQSTLGLLIRKCAI